MITLAMSLAVATAPALDTAPETKNGRFVSDVLYRFAECVAKRRSKDVIKVFETEPNSDAEMRALARAGRTDMDCPQLSPVGGLKVRIPVFVGSLSEAYYHRALRGKAATLEPNEHLPEWPDDLSPSDPNFIWLNRRHFGWCLSFRDPSGVASLLETAPLSPDESAAINALGSTVKSCGREIKVSEVSRQELRASAAEGLVNRILHRDGVVAVETE